MNRVTKICEALVHWAAYQLIAIRLGAWRPRHLLHDLDKVVMIVFFGDCLATRVHRRIAGHHRLLSEDDLVDAVIDWESARFTKPDKPLNARETAAKYYSSHMERLESVFLRLGL